jgi:hypothetical protein
MVKLEKNTEDPFKLPEASEQVCCTIHGSLELQSLWGTFNLDSVFSLCSFDTIPGSVMFLAKFFNKIFLVAEDKA